MLFKILLMTGRSKESKYCGVVMNEHFSKELIMTKTVDEELENSIK